MKPDERAFEEHIARSLVERGGYGEVKVGNASGDFDAGRGLDLTELFSFIRETQPEAWTQLAKRHGGETKAQGRFAERLVKELDARGTVDVLRYGVVDLGITIRLAFFKPAHGLTRELVGRYEANRLTVTRQLPYEADSNRTLDLALFVNGLPVATAELKNALTGQGVEDAKEQYRKRRDPKNVTLARRAVVHFAVDTEQVAMTTRLAGGSTRFLPFNRGHEGGRGNPPNPQGHRTAYLWERVWEKEAWLDLLGRFVHVEKPARGSKSSGTVIFPRYHQWDAVLAMTSHARRHGAGESYLVQHSAGSGKSNTIAWLAHRLSSLHSAENRKVFDKVVVITDRVVLDKQLQDTIYQFEHAHGVVQKIDESAAQLAEALAGESARIVITTLQKFPFVLDRVENLPDRRYAVLIDEAHSSQTGETAKDLRKVLGSGPVQSTDLAAEGAGDYDAGEVASPAEDALMREVEARGRQQNLSFFAFTATPKGRTLEMFGTYDEEAGHNVPFHLYSMRQAIEEGFIHDVLESYLTYQTYWKIEKRAQGDPEYDTGRAGAAIARFVTLHEYNLSQKAEVIVEHFRRHVAHKIGGRAKAMVVTSSRKHAVRMAHALRKYVNGHGYGALGILVAFSGTVEDEGISFTEAQMNGFPESQTPREFEEDEWRFLVVADKYQTGFDQPLLYAMYVDKVLTGLAAVQTLSRLNRRAEEKDGTFVLDFRNDADAIRAEFEPYYGETVAPPTDPNLLYDTRHTLDEYGVLRADEVEKVAALLVAEDSDRNHARIHAALAPAIERFNALEDEERETFRDALTRFVRTYSFLSQVVRFTDAGLERDYRFCRALSAFIRRDAGASLDLGSEVELTHLHMEPTFEGSVSLEAKQGIVTTIYDGVGPRQEPEASPLSQIISRLNERFGLKLTEADRIHLDGIAQELVDDETVQRQAAANTMGNFEVQFPQHFQKAVVDRLSGAEEFSYKLLGDEDLSEQVRQVYLPLVYGRAKVAWQEHCPIGELLGPPPREDEHLEYKSTFRARADAGELFKPLQTASLKTIAAFLNSREGGTLLIGVADDGSVFGIESDYATLRKEGKDDRDLFLLHLNQAVINAIGMAAAANVGTEILEVGGRDLCRVHVKPSSFPVEAEVVEVNKNGQHIKKKLFYVRSGNGTRSIPDPQERERYQAQVWGP
jgi:type I restriction enzyme R subunit